MRRTPQTPSALPVAPPPRRRWRSILSLLALAGLSALVALGCAVTCRPGWYTPTSIDRALFKADKRALVKLLDDIGSALNAGRPIDVEVDQAQLNRWLAARATWPVPPPAEIADLQYLRVALLGAQRVRVGATVEWAGHRWVVSFTGRIERRPGELYLHCEARHLGVLRVPRLLLRRAADWRGADDRVRRLLSDGLLGVPDRGIWSNGRRPFRLRAVAVSQGVLRVSLSPIRE